jgi:nicotinamidase/pyrazinamidase
MKIASFDVDAQKGFTPLRPDELPVKGGDEIVGELNAQAALADYRVGSKDCHPPKALWTADAEHPQFTPVKDGGTNVDIHWNAHCVVGTKGNELLDGLPKVVDYDYFVFKGIEPDLHPYGACYHDMGDTLSTGVIEWLKSKDVKVVIVGGLAYDYCVKTTAIQLRKAGFIVVVNDIATRAISTETQMVADVEMSKLGIRTIYGGTASVESWLRDLKNFAKMLGA